MIKLNFILDDPRQIAVRVVRFVKHHGDLRSFEIGSGEVRSLGDDLLVCRLLSVLIAFSVWLQGTFRVLSGC